MPPVSKTLVPSLITKAEAAEIICKSLYESTQENLGTNKVAISVRGATTHNFGYSVHTNLTHLPREPKPLLSYCPTGYDYYEVITNFTQDYLPCDQLMTRGEFLMELMNILEAKYKDLSDSTKKTLGPSYLDAIDLIRNTYETRELTDLSYLEGAD